MAPIKTARTAAGLALVLLLGGCSTTQWRREADEQVLGIVNEKSGRVPGMVEGFDIERTRPGFLDELPLQPAHRLYLSEGETAPGVTADAPEEPSVALEVQEGPEALESFLGEALVSEKGARVLDLEHALALAFMNSRGYQDQRESLYLSALSLTAVRHQFEPLFTTTASGDYVRSTRDVQKLSDTANLALAAPQVISAVGQLVGTPGDLLSRYGQLVSQATRVTGVSEPDELIVDDRSLQGGTSHGVSLLLKGGGRLAANLTTNFLRFLTGDPREAASSALTASFDQPLLRGAGSDIAAENLTQAERDVLYAIRNFTRFRKSFAVSIATEYYNVLQARDRVKNNYRNYQSFIRNELRDRALAREGRKTQADLGRSESATLNAESQWISSVRQYQRQLDQFKITLGLSPTELLVLDPAELDALQDDVRAIEEEVAMENAIEVAMVSRLDLLTQADQVYDAERKLDVAANAAKPGLDLVLGATVNSLDDNRWEQLDFERARWSAGFDLDLPLDDLDERNRYRTSLISLDRANRGFEEFRDGVILDVRTAWRNLEQARREFDIQKRSVEISRQRVREQELLAELGRSRTLDQIDAQNALVASENQLTSALVNYTLTRLQFWRDMGILYIKPDGQWEDVTDANIS